MGYKDFSYFNYMRRINVISDIVNANDKVIYIQYYKMEFNSKISFQNKPKDDLISAGAL